MNLIEYEDKLLLNVSNIEYTRTCSLRNLLHNNISSLDEVQQLKKYVPKLDKIIIGVGYILPNSWEESSKVIEGFYDLEFIGNIEYDDRILILKYRQINYNDDGQDVFKNVKISDIEREFINGMKYEDFNSFCELYSKIVTVLEPIISSIYESGQVVIIDI